MNCLQGAETDGCMIITAQERPGGPVDLYLVGDTLQHIREKIETLSGTTPDPTLPIQDISTACILPAFPNFSLEQLTFAEATGPLLNLNFPRRIAPDFDWEQQRRYAALQLFSRHEDCHFPAAYVNLSTLTPPITVQDVTIPWSVLFDIVIKGKHMQCQIRGSTFRYQGHFDWPLIVTTYPTISDSFTAVQNRWSNRPIIAEDLPAMPHTLAWAAQTTSNTAQNKVIQDMNLTPLVVPIAEDPQENTQYGGFTIPLRLWDHDPDIRLLMMLQGHSLYAPDNFYCRCTSCKISTLWPSFKEKVERLVDAQVGFPTPLTSICVGYLLGPHELLTDYPERYPERFIEKALRETRGTIRNQCKSYFKERTSPLVHRLNSPLLHAISHSIPPICLAAGAAMYIAYKQRCALKRS